MSDRYCPHCAMLVADADGPWPVPARRCTFCDLLIGTGRATAAPAAEAGERAHASAAGVMRGRAVAACGEVLDREAVLDALEAIALEEGCTSLGRLRMLDYARHAARDESLPSVASVVATFGGWKAATRGTDRATMRLSPAV